MNYQEHLTKLRESYYKAYPSQRVSVARQRIDSSGEGPNKLVAIVSAIEGVLRSLVIWGEARGIRPDEEIYNKYKRWGVRKLFCEYLNQHSLSGETIVSDDIYRNVNYAVEYRNLLAHECTYLGKSTFVELIAACECFFDSLCKHAGIGSS